MKLEDVSCPLCGSNDYHEFLRRKDLNLFVPSDFRLVKCQTCELVYLNPRPTPDSFNEIYPKEYDQFTIGVRQESWFARKVREYGLTKRAQAIQKFKKQGNLLDVGCATGDFLQIMEEMPGWKVTGLEPGVEASAYARDQLGLDVYHGTVEEIDFPTQCFDVITLWNVLEHLSNPNAVLQRLMGWLKPAGLLVFNTPNLDSLDARLFGQFWIGYELPRHFMVFSRRSLTHLLTQTGFKIIERQCIYGSFALFMSGVRFWLRGSSTPPRIHHRLEKIMFSLPLRVATVPLFWILDALKVTTAPTNFCVKVGGGAK